METLFIFIGIIACLAIGLAMVLFVAFIRFFIALFIVGAITLYVIFAAMSGGAS